MQNLLNTMNEHQQAFAKKADVYANYLDLDGRPSEQLNKFRLALLHHLAQSIVLREHKDRYQKEQFDRFMMSRGNKSLMNHIEPLRMFAKHYASFVEHHIDESNNFSCPKIEANYDDHGQQTIRPLNATIFYYFFSANRSGKTFAQWMLAAARYPNDKVRRAYMRFFA